MFFGVLKARWILKLCWSQHFICWLFGNLTKLMSNVNWDLGKLFWNIHVFFVHVNWAFSWYMHKLVAEILKTFVIHKPTRFLKSRHYVIIFLNNVIVEEMARRFYCVIDVNLWLKLVTIPLIELQLCKNMFYEDLSRKMYILERVGLQSWSIS